jgi:sugar lactone lactonase YvrE
VLQPFVAGLAFAESPRWHAGALWFSDLYRRCVVRAWPDGRMETMLSLDDQPSGLGWLPGGDLLVVAMTSRRVLRWDGRHVTVHADLSTLAPAPCNDMLVDAQGRAWVGHFGFDLPGRAPFAPASLIRVDPPGQAQVAAPDLHFPNGTVLTPDGRTLIVAESYGQRLTAFDVDDNGTLSHRRVWAGFEGRIGPDGICLDAEGAIWIASPVSREVLRVREGGTITHRIPTREQAVACMLGGEDRRTLYVCTGKVMVTPEQACAALGSEILQMRVAVAGAGMP